MANIISPEDYGCVGDGSTDDTLAMQATLNAASASGKAIINRSTAIYACSQLVIDGGTIWDLNNSTLKALPNLSVSQPFLANRVKTGGINLTYDDHIRILCGTLLCELGADRTAEYLSFVKCGGLVLEELRINGPQYIGLALSGCKEAMINGVTITGTGKVAVTTEGGAAIWLGANGDGSTTDDTVIDTPYIHDTNWAGIYATSKNCRILNPRMINIKEAAIFASAASSGMQLIGGLIDGVTRKYISGSGLELGGVYHSVSGAVIKNTDNCGVSLTDVQNMTIGILSTVNARRDAAMFTSASHIEVISHGQGGSTGVESSRDIAINGHLGVDYSLPSFAAVNVDGSASGAPVLGLSIVGNNYATTGFASGGPLHINPKFWGASCRHACNNGVAD